MEKLSALLKKEFEELGITITVEITAELILRMLNNKNARRAFILRIAEEMIILSQLQEYGSEEEKEQAASEHAIPGLKMKNRDFTLCKTRIGSYGNDHC